MSNKKKIIKFPVKKVNRKRMGYKSDGNETFENTLIKQTIELKITSEFLPRY